MIAYCITCGKEIDRMNNRDCIAAAGWLHKAGGGVINSSTGRKTEGGSAGCKIIIGGNLETYKCPSYPLNHQPNLSLKHPVFNRT